MTRTALNGTFLGSDVTMKENPFLVDDISGGQNRILNAVKNPTNVLVYRNDPPSVHIVGTETPTLLNVNQKDLTMVPIIPNSIKVLLIRENALKSVKRLSGHPCMEVLEASSNLIETVEFNPNPPNLKALILASNSITKFTANDFFTKLQVLNLSGNRLTEFDFGMFPVLRTLNLSFNSFINFEINSASLIELSLQNNSLSEIAVVNCRSLSHLDVSSNHLTDFSIFEKMPALTHLQAMGNEFIDNWVSFVVTYSASLTHINGREVKDGERAIHKDRVTKFMKSTTTPYPHRQISDIRQSFRRLKDIQVTPEDSTDDVETIWCARSKERAARTELVYDGAAKLKCVSTLTEEGCLTIYGAINSDEFMEKPFTTLRLHYVPITRGSETERRVMELGQKEPTMLVLDHNLLSTSDDLMFLTAFPSVTVLQIDGNPVMHGTLFRPLVSYLMPMLQVVNGQQISLAEKLSGIAHFKHVLMVLKNMEIETGLPEEDGNE